VPGEAPPLIEQLCQVLLAAGKLPIVAAGNDGPGHSRYPGNCRGVLSVGCMTRKRRVADFSSSQRRGSGRSLIQVPSLVAPGQDVWSCDTRGGYYRLTGGTAATAIVAGVAALLLQAQPRLSPAALRKALMASCVPLNEPVERQGNGLIQVGSLS
jgi:subtilisin family serine protease